MKYNFLKKQSTRLLFLFYRLWLPCLLLPPYLYSQHNDMKAIWIQRASISDINKIGPIVNILDKNGFTDAFVQVVGRGDAYYKSTILPIAESIADTTFDPLSDFILKAHSKNIKVHAWVNMFLAWSGPQLPKSKIHVRNSHPDWFVTSLDGRSILFKNKSELDKLGGEGYFLAPSSAEVRSFLINVLAELVTNYPLDGVHLDYVRYPDSEYDFSDQVRTDFMTKYYIDPKPIIVFSDSIIQRYGSLAWSSWMNQWIGFQEDYLNDFVKNISRAVKTKKENLILSIAVKPDYQIARRRFYQDWKTWVDQNEVDFVVPMNYTPDRNLFKSRQIEIDSLIPNRRYLMGISTYNQTLAQVQEKIQISLSQKPLGICIFSYDKMVQSVPFITFMKQLKNGEE